MRKSFPFQCIFSASLPTFQKGVHCTKALHPLLHPLTRAVCAVQSAVRFSTLMGGGRTMREYQARCTHGASI